MSENKWQFETGSSLWTSSQPRSNDMVWWLAAA